MTGAARLNVACAGAGYFSQFHYGSWARMDRVTLVGSLVLISFVAEFGRIDVDALLESISAANESAPAPAHEGEHLFATERLVVSHGAVGAPG